ncbi:Hypothetical predicted protein [Mytilus galloprovincialis]|uniref:Uncharacterized protein n=1 Tax=Mytilus galloprovincialis TaxID=29158 RepID=A0A8B6HKF1_MYTGA|nr:Hypothetical predicted protein [Mytilus galloprovincialis]
MAYATARIYNQLHQLFYLGTKFLKVFYKVDEENIYEYRNSDDLPDQRTGPDKNSDIEKVTELTDTNQVESVIVCADNLVDLTDQVNETESANVSTANLVETTDHIVTLEHHSHDDNNQLAIIENENSEEHIDIIFEKAMGYCTENNMQNPVEIPRYIFKRWL